MEASMLQASAKNHHQAQGNGKVNYQLHTPIRTFHLLNEATHFPQWSTVPTGHRQNIPSHICSGVSEQWLSSLHGLNSPTTYLIICLFTGIYFNSYIVTGRNLGHSLVQSSVSACKPYNKACILIRPVISPKFLGFNEPFPGFHLQTHTL